MKYNNMYHIIIEERKGKERKGRNTNERKTGKVLGTFHVQIMHGISVMCCNSTKCWYNESTTGADASVEALKLYHMKLTVTV